MGSKRVGLARTQALLENLKRELSMGNTKFVGTSRGIGNDGSAITADTTLTVADSGKLILIDASSSGNFTITLPTAEAGLEFEFLTINDHHAAAEVLVDTGSGVKIQGMTMKVATDMEDGAIAHHDNQKLGLGDATKRGARFKLTCYSSTRYIIQQAESTTTWITAFS